MTQAVGKIHHNPSHARLLHHATGPRLPSNRPRSTRLDALIIPASRPASSFTNLIELSARIETLLVVMCSKQTRVDQVAERVARTPGARALIVAVPEDYTLPLDPFRTSRPEFEKVAGGRKSDLSLKRNLGLVLARLSGWTKILFLDDDITLSKLGSFRRLAAQLDDNPIVGMINRQFPDNSVVCHARRLAKLKQDSFVSGAVLGVNCGDLPLPFFPDVYNEDWFFFSRAVARNDLAYVGDASQKPYEPFADPKRARHEEFGDLLAEGLYWLMGSVNDRWLQYNQLLGIAGWEFWADAIHARYEIIEETRQRLVRFGADGDDEAAQALRSLEASEQQLSLIEPELCAGFVESWLHDLRNWESFIDPVCAVGNVRSATDFLGLKQWRRAYFGCPGGE